MGILRKIIRYFLLIISFLLMFDGIGRLVFLIIGIIGNLGANFNIFALGGMIVAYIIIAVIGYVVLLYTDKLKETKKTK